MRALLLLLALAPARAAEPPGFFPCEPGSFPRKPRILVLGEVHFDPYDVKDMAVRDAARGLYYAALEMESLSVPVPSGRADHIVARLGLPVESGRLFGLEGTPAGAFALLWNVSNIESWSQAHASFLLRKIAANPLVQEAFLSALENGRIVDERASALIRAAVPVELGPEDIDRLRQAAGRARVEAARILRREYSQPWVDGFVDRLDAEGNTDDPWLGWMMDVRDRDYALGAASLYCSAGLEGRDLVVIVGFDHAPGVAKLLARWSPVPLGLIELDASDEDGAEKAKDLLRSWTEGR